jgi:hypothetical protein
MWVVRRTGSSCSIRIVGVSSLLSRYLGSIQAVSSAMVQYVWTPFTHALNVNGWVMVHVHHGR